MSATPAQILEAARQHAGLSRRDLWIGYYAIGGLADPSTLAAYLTGELEPDRFQYDVIAQAINDSFVGAGSDHPVPYAEDLSPSVFRDLS